MTTFLRFFILALPPLLGVTGSFGPAFLYGVTTTLVLAAVTTLIWFVRPRLKESLLLWAVIGLGVVVVTVVDLVTSLFLPSVRSAWGLYLNLLAFLPLVATLPLERTPAEDWGTELMASVKTGVLLTLLFSLSGLFREAVGHGSVTLVPGTLAWTVAGTDPWPLAILVTGAGGFLLAATGVVVVRALRSRLERVPLWGDYWGSSVPSTPTVSSPAPRVDVEPEALESLDAWGEDLTSAAVSLASTGEKSRMLVIGSGNGEVAYYLALLGLEGAKNAGDRVPSFAVRGVDHFATRVETAQRGVYRDHQVDFIPLALREAWMTQGSGDEKHLWKVGPEPRKYVQFEVADFQTGPVFFAQPAHLIVVNQGIEYVSDEKKSAFLRTVCANLVSGGALVVTGPLKRELLPEGMKRTGTTVFRKS